MSLYPILSKYDIDLESITLGTPKKYSTEKEAVGLETGKKIKIKRNYSKYAVNYKYDRIGIEKLYFMTQFLKISSWNKNKLVFSVDITNNFKLKKFITTSLDYLKTIICLEKPNLSPSDIKTPFFTKTNDIGNDIDNGNGNGNGNNNDIDNGNGNDNDIDNGIGNGIGNSNVDETETAEIVTNTEEYIQISLMNFNKKVTTPIHYHRTKKQGGNIITIVNHNINVFDDEMVKEMNSFKYNSYAKPFKLNKNSENNKLPPMYYEGKFILTFSVDYLESIVEFDDKKHEYCTINIVAKEIETKYNVSHVKSILDVDTTTLNRVVTKQSDILTI